MQTPGWSQVAVSMTLLLIPAVVAEATQDFAPVAVERIEPLPAIDWGDEEGPSEGLAEVPEVYPTDKETWELIKEYARIAPGSPRPNSIVSPPIFATRSVLTSFPGWGFQQIQPSDTTLARSGQRVLQAINSAIQLMDTNGNVLHGRTLANFFTTSETPFDPQVIYDRNATNPRFFVVASTYTENPPNNSRVLLGVSRQPNPPNLNAVNWCRYSILTHSDYGTTYDTWADQPRIGAGADTFVLAENHYTVAAPTTFTFAVIHAFDKVGMVDNAADCPIIKSEVHRPAGSPGDLNVFSLQPALHYNSPSSFAGTTNPSYLVSTNPTNQTLYWVWRLRNIPNGASPGNLQMTSVAGADIYAVPPDAPQPGTGTLIDTGDARVQKVGGVDNSLWVAHSTFCNIGGGLNESCARVVRINVGQDAGGSPTAAIGQELSFGGGANVFYWMPGIAVNQTHRTAVAFLWSSATVYLSSAWTAKNAGQTSYPAAQVLGAGSCTRLDAFPVVRSGDYVGSQTDPTDFLTFWMSAEYASIFPPPPSGSACTFRTNIFHLD